MSAASRLFVLAITVTAVAFSTGRFGAEKGARGHHTRLSASSDHTCAILDDGSVRCWGNNTSGQLGDGTTTSPRTSPVAVSGLYGAVSVAAGAKHTCAIIRFGLVQCWGDNTNGELGNGQSGLGTSSPVPVTVSNLQNVVTLAAGNSFTCAVRVDGTAWCWGVGSSGQLGAGPSVAASNVPVQVLGITGAVAITAGNQHACALLVNASNPGLVNCWGSNSALQLGNSGGSESAPVPAQTSLLGGIGGVDLAAGGAFTCLQQSDGSVSCWGADLDGQLGNGITTAQSFPTNAGVSPAVVAFATGDRHACAILVNGTVSCWGSNLNGQLGFPVISPFEPSPDPPVPTVANAVEIAAGSKHTCAMLVNGTVRCWGDNSVGQLGDGTTNPVGIDSVSGVSGTFLGRGVAAGAVLTCGRRGLGTAACWGHDGDGQLGDSITGTDSLNPAAVSALAGVTAVSAGNFAHACALDAVGGAQCWGNNAHGQLGNGSFSGSNHPVSVLSGGIPFVAVSTGDFHSCGLTPGGLVFCWGAGGRGQLGTNLGVDSSTPVQIAGINNVVAIASGNLFSCALIVNGTVRCWGDNSHGQLGDGSTVPFNSNPVKVTALSSAIGITAGAGHACVVTTFGGVQCWGANTRGQIGYNSTLPAPFATSAQGLSTAVSVAAGSLFTCAVLADGGASCWGGNDAGELAAADSLDHLSPSPVISGFTTVNTSSGPVTIPVKLTAVVAIVTGTDTVFFNNQLIDLEHACALQSSGAIRCWGSNLNGEIGDGTTASRARPTLVNGFSANVDPAADLQSHGRTARPTALITCEPGNIAQIILSLRQGSAAGTGHADLQCTGRLLEVPVTVAAQGPSGFQPGAATATVEAIVRDEGRGGIVDDTHWTRQVTIGIEP